MGAIWLGILSMAAADAAEFNRDVRPILSDKCFGCHGPDATAKKIPLRLDSEAAAKAELGGRRAIVDGKPDESELIKRITAENKARRMPPITSGHTLSAKEIETLREWIAKGAKWQQHWSFLTPARPPAPEVSNKARVRNAMDQFVLARLEKEGLTPSREASKETLIRRVSLDLTGLGPTPAEIDSFLEDRSPNAYEKVVDRLLASPRYGERMAIRWLDAARYADTNGYQYDGERVMWRWRDWVIDAFNQNKPFDRFTLEQIAGDMLPNATAGQKMATGFNRNHRGNTEDGIVPEEYAIEYVVDRVETTSAVFLGLTMGCGRCHNHKYDPITQKEFYQFFAYFNNVPESGRAMKYGNSPPLTPAPTVEQQAQLGELERKIRTIEAEIAHHAAATRKAQAAWERELKNASPVYWSPPGMRDAHFPLDDNLPAHAGSPAIVEGKIGRAALLDGKSYFEVPAAGQFDIDDRFTLAGWFYPECSACSLMSRMNDSPKGKGFGVHLGNGKVFVAINSVWETDAIKYESEEVLEQGKWHHIAVTYDGSKMAAGHTLYVDGKPARVHVLQDNLYRPFRNAGARFTVPFRIGAGNGSGERFRGRVDDVHLYARMLKPEEIESLAVGLSLREIAARRPTPAGQRQLDWYFQHEAAPSEVRRRWKQLHTLLEEKENLERTFPTVMVMAESPVPKDTHLLIRGQYDKKGEKVQPGLPAIFGRLPEGAGNNRLGLASWLISEKNPLTARVTINRFWQMLFGAGLVKTVEDFGLQGEWPSHPDLLDWLATEFVRTGWDVKAILKTIVISATYRQSSKATPELLQRDPENRLLARGPRFRMPAEMVRDNALHAAGLLKHRPGGPSVKPYQPAGLWSELIMQDMEYVQSKGDDLYRRSLYTFWKRTVAPPMMANFDSALRETCTVRENRTNTPLQALNLMNDVTFVEAARFIGQRMMREGGADVEARLRHGFRLVTGRAPSAAEAGILRGSLQYHRDYFASKPERVKAYLSLGDSPPDTTLNGAELAAYGSVASLMLNLDEAITKE
ncbi:MAG: DUF1553 domain-containing protein [Acidobacteria bacterium]|nr:DUF1553 domain-containing protein [Acidobacteriota bacterium]